MATKLIRRLKWAGSGFLLSFLFSSLCWAQGPDPAYYYLQEIDLPWARCSVYMEGGSKVKIPFYPVVTSGVRSAPMGIGNYDRDVLVEGPVVFTGNGIVKEGIWDSYRGRRRGCLHDL